MPSKLTKSDSLKPISRKLTSYSYILPKDAVGTASTTAKSSSKPVKKSKSENNIDGGNESKPVKLDSDSLWIDQFVPTKIDDLAVHKRRIEDVRNWLQEALYNQKQQKHRRILVLSGPAGSGKTATLKILANELNTEVLEFQNGEGGFNSAENLPTQFPAFIARASLPSLQDKEQPKSSSTTKNKPKILLVEELPNIFTHVPTASYFQAALRHFLIKPSDPSSPTVLVIIVSDALSKSSTDSVQDWKDNITSRTVIPADVLQDYRCLEIRFLPIAPTILKKALNKILDNATYISETSKKPLQKDLDQLVSASNGDIRSAIHSLQFLDLNPSKNSNKRKRSSTNTKSNDANSTVGMHDNTLDLFHVVGRILFNKRWGQDLEEDAADRRTRKRVEPAPTVRMPSHLSHMEWPRSKYDPTELYGECTVDAAMLIPYLHQNYALYSHDIEQCELISDAISCADATFHDDYINNVVTTEYTFQNVLRSIQMSSSKAAPRRKQKLSKAQLWLAQREMRENETKMWAIKFDINKRTSQNVDNPISNLATSTRSIMTDVVPLLKHVNNDSKIKNFPPSIVNLIDELGSLDVDISSQGTTSTHRLEELDENGGPNATQDSLLLPTVSQLPGVANMFEEKEEILYLEDDDIQFTD